MSDKFPTKTVKKLRANRLAARAEVANSPDGTVIKFSLQLENFHGTVTYDYAALKVGGRWFTTGRTCPPAGYSPEALVDILWADLAGEPRVVGS